MGFFPLASVVSSHICACHCSLNTLGGPLRSPCTCSSSTLAASVSSELHLAGSSVTWSAAWKLWMQEAKAVGLVCFLSSRDHFLSEPNVHHFENMFHIFCAGFLFYFLVISGRRVSLVSLLHLYQKKESHQYLNSQRFLI